MWNSTPKILGDGPSSRPIDSFRFPVPECPLPSPVLRTPMNAPSFPLPYPGPSSSTTGTSFAGRSVINSATTSASRMMPGLIETPPDMESTGFRTPPPVVPRLRPRFSMGSTSVSTSGSGTTTPTSTTGGTIEPLDRSTVVAVVEGRGLARGEIGMACMNVNFPNLILCQFNDTQSYMRVISKINLFRPYEILMSAPSCDANNPSQLYKQLSKEIRDVKIVPIQRRIFNEAKGLQKITSLVADNYAPIVHSITNKYYCLAATHALMKYVETMQSTIFSPRSLRIEFQGCDQTCMIDHVTAQHLELLQNNRLPGSSHSLLGILNSCKTPHGSRLLRMNILQPSCNINLITSRHNSIEALINDREILYGLQDVLGRLPMDIEHVIGSLIQIPKLDNSRITEQRINNIIALKQILELVPTLIFVLQNAEDDYFQQVKMDLNIPQFDNMLQRIKHIINEEAQFQKGSMNMKRQRCFAVKADINPILDIARKAYCDLIDDINTYVTQLSTDAGISFRLGTNNQRGFFVQFCLPNRAQEIPDLPQHYLQVKKRGNLVTFTTESLISIDHRAQEVLKEIENLSNIIISELINEIRNEISILYKVSEAIGNLDLISSLTQYALTTVRCVRPQFSKDTTSITMGRHPILDAISEDPSVPNNTFLSDHANFMLITGPNMSGKTTYLKHVATLQVLAQLGSFVPADAATFRIASNIMSRIGTGDSIEENSSSFALEMTEMTYILQNAVNDSLIIIDELGRATSVEEGAAISWAISEELLGKESFVLFATHHMLLTKLESLYLNAINFTMETREWQEENVPEDNRQCLPSSKLQYTHVIKRGVTDVEYYGLKLAMNTCYPRHIIDNAITLSQTLMKDRGIEQKYSVNDETDLRRKKYLLGSHLLLAANSLNLDEDDVNKDDLRHYLETLQEEFRTSTGIGRQNVQPSAPQGPVSTPQDTCLFLANKKSSVDRDEDGALNSSIEVIPENLLDRFNLPLINNANNEEANENAIQDAVI